jgi:hypothetical protein
MGLSKHRVLLVAVLGLAVLAGGVFVLMHRGGDNSISAPPALEASADSVPTACSRDVCRVTAALPASASRYA